MRQNKFKPFILDFIVMMFVIIVVSFCLVYNKWIEIRIIKINVVMISLSIMSLFYLLYICNNTIFLGIRALVDCCFQNYITVECVYIKQIMARNAFNEKYSMSNSRTEIKRVRATYYDVIVECEGRRMSFVSSEPMVLNENELCLFTIGKTSKVIVDCKNL